MIYEIKGKVITAGVSLSMAGDFGYDTSLKDTIPGHQNYSVDLVLSLDVRVFGYDFNPMLI